MALEQTPIKPTDFTILTVGVVVAALRAAYFVAHEHHRRAGREQFQNEKILHLAIA